VKAICPPRQLFLVSNFIESVICTSNAETTLAFVEPRRVRDNITSNRLAASLSRGCIDSLSKPNSASLAIVGQKI